MLKKVIKTRGVMCADCGEAGAQYIVFNVKANLFGLDRVSFAQVCPDCLKGDIYNAE